MKARLFPLVALGFFACAYELGADGPFTLVSIDVVGNRRTAESYVRAMVALEAGTLYELDELLSGINRSRENLESTGLFESVFFDDRVDDRNNVGLTVRLVEKNFFHLGPVGYLSYYRGGVASLVGLSFSHANLFGNGTRLDVQVPVYENVELLVNLDGRAGGVRYGFLGGYSNSFTEEEVWYTAAPAVAFGLDGDSWLGARAMLNWDDFTSLILYPFFETGSNERPHGSRKKWSRFFLSPSLGYSFGGSSVYGLDAEAAFYRDIFLQIVSASIVGVGWIDGDVPRNLEVKSNVRGNRFDRLTGDYQVWATQELRAPLPWKQNVVLVPFVDAALVGSGSPDFIMGGGVGLRWYGGLFDPLVIDVAFGRGFSVHFQKTLM